MQTVSSKIWIRFAIFIPYDDNRYTTRAFLPKIYKYIKLNLLLFTFCL